MAPSSIWEDGALRINPPEYQFGKYYKGALLVKQVHCLHFNLICFSRNTTLSQLTLFRPFSCSTVRTPAMAPSRSAQLANLGCFPPSRTRSPQIFKYISNIQILSSSFKDSITSACCSQRRVASWARVRLPPYTVREPHRAVSSQRATSKSGASGQLVSS